MLYPSIVGDKLRDRLFALDLHIAENVAHAGCPHCGDRLDRADYPRKPRGGGIFSEGETFTRRISLCCSRPGCRKRATPPSVRFLGRKVYLAAVILIACVLTQLRTETRALTIAHRTIRRWLSWWQSSFASSACLARARGYFVPALEIGELPASLLVRFEQDNAEAQLAAALAFIAPITTGSVHDGARFVRAR